METVGRSGIGGENYDAAGLFSNFTPTQKGVGVAGVQDVDSAKPAAIEAKDVRDRARTGSTVEDAGPTSQHRLPAFPRGVGERETRRKIVVVFEEILPFVAQTQTDRQIRPQPNVILHEPTDLFVPESQAAVALSLCKGERSAVLETRQGREVEHSIEITSLIGGKSIKTRDLDSCLDSVLSNRPGEHIRKLETVSAGATIKLCTTACESVKHDGLYDARLSAAGESFPSYSTKRKLVEETGGHYGGVTVTELVLPTCVIGRRLWEIESSHPRA